MRLGWPYILRALALVWGAFIFQMPSIFAQTTVLIREEQNSVIVKTPTDVLRLTACSETLIHITASPDGKALSASPHEPWMVSTCSPHKFAGLYLGGDGFVYRCLSITIDEQLLSARKAA